MDDAVRERLRALRSLLLLEDDEAIGDQVRKLRDAGATHDARVEAIVEAVRSDAPGEAVALIETTLAETESTLQAVEVHADREADRALREEVERLEAHRTELESEEAELQRRLRTFGARYRDELGPLVNELLRLRKERLEQSLYAKRSSRTRRAAFNEADAQFERFQQVIEETGEAPADASLSDDEQERLKAAYRRASKLCHPDAVDPAMEDEARTYFNELREAYQENDLARVEEIAETLTASGFARPVDNAAADRTRLEARAERLRRQIDELEASLEAMRASKAYEAVQSVSDLDAYFDALKQRLRREIRRLRQGRRVRG